MAKLNERDKERIIELLEKGEDLPLDYKHILFPPEKKEYELVYAGKEREEDILADTMAVPLQPIKSFGGNGTDWKNKLIFGDNLQVMKSLLDDPDVKGQVKLIYIDPPFGTGDEYSVKNGQAAYTAKKKGAEFIEFLRKRLIFLREILSRDGAIYCRIDYHFGHYLKSIKDEVFGQNNFRNEIIVNRGRNVAGAKGGKLEVDNDFILWYSKTNNFLFKDNEVKVQRPISEIKWTSFLMAGDRFPRERTFIEKTLLPPDGQHFSLVQDKVDKLLEEFHLRLRCKNCGTRYYNCESQEELYKVMKRKKHIFKFYDIKSDTRFLAAKKLNNCIECGEDDFAVDYLGSDEKKISNIWLDIESYSKRTKYPTENSEELLERIIKASSNKNDIIIDAFAGSGTTLAVAEKLGRRWIGIDCGKLAIYTMQKRLLNLKSEIGNKGKKLKPKPFTLYHAGLYDFAMLKKLPWPEWRKFALLLFNCRDNKHRVSGLELDGYKGRSDVLVFDYQKEGGVVLDYGFIEDLHSMIGSKIGSHFFIIAPAASVTFLEDYIDKGSVRYYILRIPYSIINELHSKNFEAIKQPIDESQVNDTVDAVGFDFIRQPKVECSYLIEKPKDQLLEYAVIKIKTFKSEAMLKGASQLGNRESLSMIMVDFDYDGEIFNLDKTYYASEIEKNGWKVLLPLENIKKQIMIIYLDIYGNEYREIKTLQDFGDPKQVKRRGE